MTTTEHESTAREPGPRRSREHVDTVVVGAGQTGLATAYFLGRAGVRAVVLDEHARVGDQWRHRYRSLRLNTPAQYDGLPGMAFPGRRNTFPAGEEMGDFLEAYAQRMDLAVRGGTTVRRVAADAAGGYLVSCGDSELHARNVVVATGGEHHPRVPAFADELDPGIRQIHSSGYRDPEQLLPGPVLVVGAGQSGADLALEARHAGHETWLSGNPPAEIPFRLESRRARIALPLLWFAADHVLTVRTPLGRRARPRIRAGAAPLLRVKRADLDAAGVRRTDSRTAGVRAGLPVLADGRSLDVANVVWCTGFRQEFGFVDPPVIGADGWPEERGGVVPSAPGLYFVGLLFQTAFSSMLIGGAGRDAARVARHIAARSQQRQSVGA